MIEVREYLDPRGRSPYRDWLVRLDVVARAQITTSVLRLENGNFSQSKSIGAGVSELRLDFGPGYRVYFGGDGETLIILLGGGTKKRQNSDIEAAKSLWLEYKRRKREI